ncbi:MAG TPA: LD-carboxypeptidase [Candidatus Kapabacteria bacterium]|nr:LD-carboxypeptidase [Candidatus Kapabacteria bacterium]
MSSRSRRRFIQTIIGGAVAAPAVLRAQVDTPAIYLPATPADSTRHNDSLLTPGPPAHSTPKRAEHRRAHGEKEKEQPLPLIKPPALKDGSTIALVAPASGLSHGEAMDAAATLRSLGFNVKVGEHLTKEYGYLSAKDDARAEEFMKFVLDPEVNCIMAVRGGYGVMRILPKLDWAAIRANPKVIMGYSDITALVNPIYKLSGMVAFHGPVASSTFDRYTLDSFRRTVMSAAPAGEFGESDEFKGEVFSERRASTIVSGTGQGRLVGGNLSLVTALMGTPYEIDTEGKILFIEEVEEEPYRVDRMLMQLVLGGKLQKCAGIAIGRFTKCESRTRGGEFRMSLSLEEIVHGLLEPLKVPTVYGLSIGHIKSKLTVPVGGLATLDADARTIRIDEAAVR